MAASPQSQPVDKDDTKSNESHDEESSQSGSGSDESEAEPVESLIAGRQRRERAGNRYAQLLLLEQQKAAEANEDDDLALLFAEEQEEDVEFEEGVAAEAGIDEEEGDDSSTDEEDKGTANADYDLEGEKQLEKEERAARRANKRKAEQAITKPAARRKRVKIDDKPQTVTSPGASAVARPRKKSERVSWLPPTTEGSLRASSRTLSVQNKEKTLASMKVSESRRLRQMAVLEAAQRRRETKRKPKSQAERLAEAAQIERLNSKSLNKWEETEKDRLEKQKAKLEALQNRKLLGPVIRWYSGPADWADDKLVRVGKKSIKVEVVEASKDVGSPESMIIPPAPKIVAHEHKEIEDGGGATEISKATEAVELTREHGSITQTLHTESELPTGTSTTHPAPLPPATNTPENTEAVGFMDGLEYYASLPSEGPKVDVVQETLKPLYSSSILEAVPAPGSNSADNNGTPSAVHTKPTTSETTTTISMTETAPAKSSSATPLLQVATGPETQDSNVSAAHDKTILPTQQPPSPPTQTTTSARNLITFLDFDPTAIRDKDVQRRLLFCWPTASSFRNSSSAHTTTTTSRRSLKEPASAYIPVKPVQPACVITGMPAKYRDPLTGLAYADMDGFKALRRLADGGDKGGVWSSLLQAWVGGGEITRPAGRVPAGFLKALGMDEVVKLESVP